MKTARLKQIFVHYSDEGPKTGKAIVFSNSLGTDLRIWDFTVERLPADFRIIRYDTRGHGLSEVPEAPYFMGDLVGDAAQLLDHLGVKDVLFVGLSIGGLIAQGLAAERPDLVKAMVLADTACKIGTPSVWDQRIEAISKSGLEAHGQEVMDRWFSKSFQDGHPALLSACRAMLTSTQEAGYLGCCHAISNTDLYESTAALKLPALAVVGRNDKATPPDLVRETAALIEGCRFEMIPKAGHIPCVEQPEEFTRLLTEFLAEIGWM